MQKEKVSGKAEKEKREGVDHVNAQKEECARCEGTKERKCAG